MTRTILCNGDSNTFGTIPMANLGDGGHFARGERWPHVVASALGDGAGQVVAVSPVDGIHLSGDAQRGLALALADEVKHHFIGA